ncbi:hypothetical protein VTL71DRAFT_1271 [Oculimacula yallundae]|uniref:DUF1989 domain-containing protein n=1 Tax=Oculimacula yallundae TaxID=86028 RepID=A0ABR4CA76_9HELO
MSSSPTKSLTIPAKHGTAIPLLAQQCIKIHNKHGNQVVDTWAFTLPSSSLSTTVPPTQKSTKPLSHLSTSQTRSQLRKIRPSLKDTFVDNHCVPIISLIEDTSGGVHDMLFPACNPQRYAHLKSELEKEGKEPHRSCAQNCIEAAREVGVEVREEEVPSPLNLFMCVEIDQDGKIELREPKSGKGSWVVLRAEVECLVVLSACPNDISAVNAWRCRDVEVEVL